MSHCLTVPLSHCTAPPVAAGDGDQTVCRAHHRCAAQWGKVAQRQLDNRHSRLCGGGGRGRFVKVAAAPLYFFLCGN
eukprot:1178850-Prorocentrum_minimum.AAC.1